MIVHTDQTYCVPDRTIMDNIFLIRDVIDVCRSDTNVNFGIVCLDQEKAFDRVDHSYLFSALRAFGFGDGFLAWIDLLYSGAQCLAQVHRLDATKEPGGGHSESHPGFFLVWQTLGPSSSPLSACG